MNIVDARGLSCPQPVMMTLDKIKEIESGEIEVLVDTDTSKENVCRAAHSKGWDIIEIREEKDTYRIKIKKL